MTAGRRRAAPAKKKGPARRKKQTPSQRSAARQAAPSRGRRRETREERIERTAAIVARLEAAYPQARCALDHQNALQLLVATILSAQCTDARVNMVTPGLFARYPTARAFAEADPAELERAIQSTGFFRNKARSLIGCCQALLVRHGGEIPGDLESLVELPGVGRKTANVVLGNVFGIPSVVVDTHVTRLSQLLGLSSQKDPNKIELDLMEIVPREKWTLLAHLLIEHGRRVCIARRPQCPSCALADLCPSSLV